jgi:hypothetical protein
MIKAMKIREKLGRDYIDKTIKSVKISGCDIQKDA